ncbi:MAG: CreA family protein [Alphaproteobacteria bacterium]|nr:CreA family protein [Alphaproteobacteria bacterium]
MDKLFSLMAAAGLLVAGAAQAEEIGEVSTVWKMVGPNHKITVEVFDDPDMPNISCWVSRPVSGGVKGAVGLAEDPSDGSIACHQRGPVELTPALRTQLGKETGSHGVQVFKARTSLVFKTMQVTRLFDARRNAVVYLIWSDKLVEGSPKNSLSVVALVPWPATPKAPEPNK